MSSKSPTQLGAQRLYNAIKAGNVGFVAMYCTSLTNGNVQQFDPVKVFEAWAPTDNVELLNVLLTVPMLRHFNRAYRYRSPNHSFGYALLQKVNALTPDDTTIPFIRSVVMALEVNHCSPPYDDVGSKLEAALASGVTWPYATMAESRRLSEYMLGLPYNNQPGTSVEVVDWYVDQFGVIAEKPSGYLRSSVTNLFRMKRWLQLEKLIPDLAVRKEVFAQEWNINHPIKHAVDEHHYYLELLRIAPWIKDEKPDDDE